jgi:hypothetical protein
MLATASALAGCWKRPSLAFSARREKTTVFALLHFSNTYVFEKCAAQPCTALAELPKIVFQQPVRKDAETQVSILLLRALSTSLSGLAGVSNQ